MRTVYIHTTPDGKKYVGATRIDPNRRFNKGRGYRYQFFYQAVLKFGWENISHQLYEVDTEEEMHYLEKYLIAYYDTTNPDKGYNIVKGDLTQDHGMDHPEYGKGGGYSRYKDNFRKYQTSEKGKETYKKYRFSEKGKETRRKYNISYKEKESHRVSIQRYNHSEKHKLTVKRYLEKKKKQMKNE